MDKKNIYGTLYIVATPIGNLADITFRAIDILKEVDLIVAEDTRQSKKLLSAYNINKKMLSLHKYNEKQQNDPIIALLKKGMDLAYIVDAGTPLISDPGAYLVSQARANEILVVPIPGPSSLTTSLSVCGLTETSFIFEGFLSSQISAKQKHLEKLKNEPRAIVFFESTHRIIETVDLIWEIFQDTRELIIAKELTKINEQIIKGSPLEVSLWLKNDKHVKGEFVVILGGYNKADEKEFLASQMLKKLLSELSIKKAVSITAEITGYSKNKIYQWALVEKEDNNTCD